MPRYRLKVEVVIDEEDPTLLQALRKISEIHPAIGTRILMDLMQRQAVSSSVDFREET